MAKMRYVLDTSAYFTLFEDEDGADTVQDLLEQAKQGDIEILTSFVSFVEVYYITLREQGEAAAASRIRLMGRLPVTKVESTPALGLATGRIKATNRLSFADAWIAATALIFDAFLVHKDPEFDHLKADIKLNPLPYKAR